MTALDAGLLACVGYCGVCLTQQRRQDGCRNHYTENVTLADDSGDG